MGLYSFGKKGKTEKFIKAHPNPTVIRAQLESFYNKTEPIYKVRADNNFVIIEGLIYIHLLNSADIVWAYHKTFTETLFYIIPILKSHAVVLRTSDGKQYHINTNTNNATKALMTILYQKLPWTFFGYSNQIETLYKKTAQSGRAEFRSLAYQQHHNSK